MAKNAKALVALLTPAFTVIYPFLVGNTWDWKTDVGPIIVGLLVAYGVYKVPNAGGTTARRGNVGRLDS